MHIIDFGYDRNFDEFILKCEICKTVFSFSEYEYCWISENRVRVNCPSCGHDFECDDIDKHMIRKIVKKY